MRRVCNPENLIQAIFDSKVNNLTVISNNWELDMSGILLQARQLRKRFQVMFVKQAFQSLAELEVDLVPQGTLAERIRVGGAGIPAFFTRLV